MKNIRSTEQVKIIQGSKILQPEFEKLGKMEKLLTKVENDMSKRMKDLDKSAIVDTMKKLGELRLDKFTSIIQKIFSGQNLLLDILLKIRINSEINPDLMLESLQTLQRNKNIQRSASADRNGPQNDQLLTPRGYGPSKLGQQLKKQTVSIAPVTDKKYVEKGTDTEIDRQDAKKISQIVAKQQELNQIAQELTETSDDVADFLKTRKNFSNTESSNAEKQLKSILKDLSVKKKRAEQIEQEGFALLSRENDFRQGYQNMENELVSGLKDVALKAKQAQEFQLKQNIKLAKEAAEGFERSTQTEKDILKEKYDKQSIENKSKEKKIAELEKKCKDAKRDTDLLESKIQKLNQKLEEYQFQERKREDDQRRVKKDKELTLSQQEKDKLKKYIEENIKMKLKMRELIDEIKKLEEENKANLDKFKRFIMNSNLTDDQKKSLLGKAEELFKVDYNKRLNIKEIEALSKFDAEMLKDSLVKDIVGTDTSTLVKKIKADKKMKEYEKMNNPNYDSDFDPDYLEEGQKIIIKKVKKKVQRLNSKGEWIEDEIEVEEEVVVDKNGNEVRKREKVKPGLVTDPAMIDFVNKHGGLAIGGSKFILPQKPGKPISVDGTPIREGEWFTDKKGNKVKMVKNINGEEEYEIEEKYVDEDGIERTRVKKMKVKKDANGEEYTEEVYVDPETGQKVKVIKKVIKDKDGAEIIEEVTIDESGNKVTKRTKVKKDKDGNDIIEEEIIDQFGNKQIIRTKRVKDQNGNDIIVKEIINADGSKIVVTEKVDKNGQRSVIEEKTDKFGNKTKVEKKIIVGQDGKLIVEETTIDEKGNKIVKKTNLLTDELGNTYTQEETLDSHGNKVIKNIRQKVDKDGNKYIEEEIINADGTKKVIKKRIDDQGNQIEEEEIIDEFGNKIVVKKIKNKDGTVTEERENLTTGEKVIIKKKVDEQGREITEEIKIDANGNSTTVKKIVFRDKNGNTIVEEQFIDPNTGEMMTIKKKIARGKDGKEIVEEQIIDSKGNVKTVKKKIFKDAEGREVVEEEIVGEDGVKYNIKKKVYKDADGNRVEEEEIIDEFGNKTIRKKKIGADGKQIIEETKISKDGKKQVTQQIINKDGTIEETVIDSTGKVTKRKLKAGMDDKQIQVDSFTVPATSSNLRTVLIQIGCPQDKVDELVDAIMKFIQKGEAIVMGDVQKITNKLNEKGMHIQTKQPEKKVFKKGRNKDSDEDQEDKLEQLDGLNEDQLVDALFKKMNQKKGEFGDLLRTIRNQMGKQGDEEIQIEDFKKYFKKLAEIHQKCGDNCPHLRRFYERLGFTWAKYRRRFLKLKDTKIQAFNKIKNQEVPQQQAIKNQIRQGSPDKTNLSLQQSAQKSYTILPQNQNSQKKINYDQEIDKQSWNNQDQVLSKDQLNSSYEFNDNISLSKKQI